MGLHSEHLYNPRYVPNDASGKSLCVNHKSRDFCLPFRLQEVSPVLRIMVAQKYNASGEFGSATLTQQRYFDMVPPVSLAALL